MILKRLGIFFFVLIVGISGGVFAIDYLSQTMHWPKGLSDFLMVVYVGVFMVVALMLGKDIPKEGVDEDLPASFSPKRKKGRGKIYAWLMPYGTENQAGFPITKKFMTIGRDVSADILINDDSISKKHAHIMSLPGGFMLKDLESKNGTFINNQRIEEAYLSDGDLITFGDMNFVFVCSKEKLDLAEAEVDLTEITMDVDDYSTQVATGTRFNTGTQTTGKSKSRLKDLSQSGTYIPNKGKKNKNSNTKTHKN